MHWVQLLHYYDYLYKGVRYYVDLINFLCGKQIYVMKIKKTLNFVGIFIIELVIREVSLKDFFQNFVQFSKAVHSTVTFSLFVTVMIFKYFR